MKRDRKRQSGYYWVRFEGAITVAEYTADGLGCSPEGPHWHITQSESCFTDKEVCELLSPRLPEPASAAAPTDTQRLESYVKCIAEEFDRLLQSDTDENGNPRDAVWFWEHDTSDAEYATFREALDDLIAASTDPAPTIPARSLTGSAPTIKPNT